MGHRVPQLMEHTFQGTGITVQIRKLSPFIQDDVKVSIRKKDKAAGKYPEPPMVPGVEGKLEPNESDPDYLNALAKYNREAKDRINAELMRVAIRRGIELDVGEDIKAQIEELRIQLEVDGIEIEETDPKIIYITRICIGSDEDTSDLYDALFRRSIPTKEAVEAHKATFPGDVPGPTN